MPSWINGDAISRPLAAYHLVLFLKKKNLSFLDLLQTALMQACRYGHWEVVQMLLLYRCNVGSLSLSETLSSLLVILFYYDKFGLGDLAVLWNVTFWFLNSQRSILTEFCFWSLRPGCLCVFRALSVRDKMLLDHHYELSILLAYFRLRGLIISVGGQLFILPQ